MSTQATNGFLSHDLSDESGVSILEMTLILPLLTLFLAGILQFGYLFTAHVVVRQAAVAATREALLSLPRRSDAEVTNFARQAVAPMLSVARMRQVIIDRNFVVNGAAGATRVELVYDLPSFLPLIEGSGPNGEFVIRVAYVMR